MNIEGYGDWLPFPDDSECQPGAGMASPVRLDSLLPLDPEYGVVTPDAVRAYLGAIMDLMARHGQPLTILTVSADPNDTLALLGAAGTRLIGSAIARCLRQETRIHDVIGRTDGVSVIPTFLIVLPLMTETIAAQFAERLRVAMTITAGDEGRSWLTLSVGLAALSLDTGSPDTLILRAQEALVSAQRAGGGRVWRHADSVRRIVEREQPDSQLE